MSFLQDTGSKFCRIALAPAELDQAMEISPYFLAYLQNKIEAYATAVVEAKLPYHPDPSKQLLAIIEYERLKNIVAAYEELLAELLSHPANQRHNQPE